MPFLNRLSLVVAPVLLLAFTVNRSGAPSHSTGAPNESTCAACHTGNMLNSPEGSIVITVPEAYTPGETVPVSVRLQRSGAPRFGFQLTAQNAAGQFVGAFDVSGSDVGFALGSPNQHVTHQPARDASGSTTWVVPWTAPAAGTGAVTFYAAGNAANGDFTNFGDFIFTTSKVIAEGSATAVESGPEVPLALQLEAAYPNPVRDGSLVLPYTAAPGRTVSLVVVDAAGRSVDARVSRDDERFVVETGGMAPGVYVARVSDGQTVRSARFTVLP